MPPKDHYYTTVVNSFKAWVVYKTLHSWEASLKSAPLSLAPSLDLEALFGHVVTGVAAAAAHARTSPGAGEAWGPAAGLCLSAPGLWLHSGHLCHTSPKCCPSSFNTGARGGAKSKCPIFTLVLCVLYFMILSELELLTTRSVLKRSGTDPLGESHQVPHPAGTKATGETVPLHHSGQCGGYSDSGCVPCATVLFCPWSCSYCQQCP